MKYKKYKLGHAFQDVGIAMYSAGMKLEGETVSQKLAKSEWEQSPEGQLAMHKKLITDVFEKQELENFMKAKAQIEMMHESFVLENKEKGNDDDDDDDEE